MAGFINPSLLRRVQGYQGGGGVGGYAMGPPQAMTPPPPPIAPPIAQSGEGMSVPGQAQVGGSSAGPPQGVGQAPGGYSMGPPQSMTAGAYAGAPPSPISGGTSTMGEGMLVPGQATAPAGGVMTQTSAPAGGGGATPPGGGTDPYSTSAGIAEQLGFDPGQYSEYFTAISPEMQAATQEATYDPYYKEQIGQLREQRGGQVAGLRQNLLQSVMQSQQAGAASGFAGGAPGGQQMLDLTRAGAESQYGDIGAAYGRGKYGVKEAISGRISGGRQAIEAAKRANIATASRLVQSGAEFTGSGGTPPPTTSFGTGTIEDYGLLPELEYDEDTGTIEGGGSNLPGGGTAFQDPNAGGGESPPPVIPTLDDSSVTGFAYGGPVPQRSLFDYLMARR